MGLFTPGGYTVNTENFDIENMTFEECAYENPFEAASYIVAESEDNYNNIIKAMALDEYAVYESTGIEMVYEAANFKAFFAKVKDFFKKLWEKIKGMFQKFFAKINSVLMKDKDFVKKYKPALLKLDSVKGFEYKGYEFTNLTDKCIGADKVQAGLKGLIEIAGASKETLTSYIADIAGEKKTALLDATRGETLGGGKKVEDSDYSDELFKYFRKGESDRQTIDSFSTSDINTQLDIISGADKAKKAAEDDLKTVKRTIDEIIKKLESAEKAAEKTTSETQSELVKAYSGTVDVLKQRMNIVTLWNGAKLRALKDQNAQAKSICVKLLTFKPKTESAGFVHTEGGSYLDSVVFK